MKPEEMMRVLFPKQLVWQVKQLVRKMFSFWGVK